MELSRHFAAAHNAPTLKYAGVRVDVPAVKHRQVDALVLPLIEFVLGVAGLKLCFGPGTESAQHDLAFDEIEEGIHVPDSPLRKARNKTNQPTDQQKNQSYEARMGCDTAYP
jgi:hypothetical protein